MLISFEIKGKFAHFRPFYTNASSLSYYFPPRTTIIGIIAGILGMERDSYYEIFSSENLDVSIEILTPIKKSIFTIKYYRTKEADLSIERFLRGVEDYPTSIEVLMPINHDFISYRIYLKFKNNSKIEEELWEILESNKVKYAPYLGISEFLAFIENPKKFEEKQEETNIIHSVIPYDYYDYVLNNDNDFLILDKMVVDFIREGNIRKIKKTNDFIVNPLAKPIKLKQKILAIKIEDKFILWMR
jgi:CRISPR-associated protein Cas5h